MERTNPSAVIANFSLLLAAIPTMRWYALRLQDGGELLNLVPLFASVWFIIRDKKSLQTSSISAWVGMGLLLLLAISYSYLPTMIRALVMIVAFTSISGIWKKSGMVCLLILGLPWAASLEFFLGYPLRLLTSISADIMLETLGIHVTRSGVQLLYDDRIIGVDPACSGINMLWSTGLLTALLAAVFSISWVRLVPLGLAALLLALLGNSLRATILFFPEAGLVNLPHILHSGIGVAIAGGCFLVLMKFARLLSKNSPEIQNRPPEAGCSRTPRTNSLIAVAALLVLCASLFSGQEIQQSSNTPSVLNSFNGIPVNRIPLTESEDKFYAHFPGAIAVYEAEGFKLIIRHVDRATRKLHPASHCLRAEGFNIGEAGVTTDDHGIEWLSYSISRSGEIFQVTERVNCETSGKNWPEISAWYWHALLNPSDGPWQAVTVITHQT